MAAKTFRELTANTAPASDRFIATQAPTGSAEPEITTLAQLGGSLPFNLNVPGSVERSLAAKVSEAWVSVTDKGAIGDGTDHPLSEGYTAAGAIAQYPWLEAYQSANSLSDADLIALNIDWAAIQSAFLTDDSVFFPDLHYVLDAFPVLSGNNRRIWSNGGALIDRKAGARSGVCIELGDCENLHIHGLRFISTQANEIYTSYGLINQRGSTIKDLFIHGNHFTCPTWFGNGIMMITTQPTAEPPVEGGSAKNIHIFRNVFEDTGAMAVTLMDRLLAGAHTRFDGAYFYENFVRNPGIFGSGDGEGQAFGISFDNFISDARCYLNRFEECDFLAIEMASGIKGGLIGYNTQENCIGTFIGLSTQSALRNSDILVVGNRQLDTLSARSLSVIDTDNLKSRDNIWIADDIGPAVVIRNSIKVKLNTDTVTSAATIAVQIGNGTNVTEEVELIDCDISNEDAGSNNSTVLFTGSGTRKNKITGGSVFRGPGGQVVSEADGATLTFIDRVRRDTDALHAEVFNQGIVDGINTLSLFSSQFPVLRLTGTLTADASLRLPIQPKMYEIWNNTTGGYAVTLTCVDAIAGRSLANGAKERVRMRADVPSVDFWATVT